MNDQDLAGKWERADRQLTILVGAAAADLLGQPPHTVALSLARLLHQRYDADTILGYAAVAITRLGMAKKAQLSAQQPGPPGDQQDQPAAGQPEADAQHPLS